MPRRKAVPLDEMMPLKQQPRSRLPHSSMIQTGEGIYAGGQGLYAGGKGIYAGGTGLYAGSNLSHKSLTGPRLIGYGLPPALQSQPFSTHYQWGVTLPPAYQRIVRGNGLYP
jgi:hypothetical protein